MHCTSLCWTWGVLARDCSGWAVYILHLALYTLMHIYYIHCTTLCTGLGTWGVLARDCSGWAVYILHLALYTLLHIYYIH